MSCPHGNPTCSTAGSTGLCGPCQIKAKTGLTLPPLAAAGCTGFSGFSGPSSIPHAVSPRAIYCDQQKHRMYRAIRESCPCFRPRTYRGHVETEGREGMLEYNKIVYFINRDGLARRISELFEKLDEL